MLSFHRILVWWWQVRVGESMLEKKDHGSKQEFYRPYVLLRVMARRAFELPWCDVHLIILDLIWYFSNIVQAHRYFPLPHWWIFHLFCGCVRFWFRVNQQCHQNHFQVLLVNQCVQGRVTALKLKPEIGVSVFPYPETLVPVLSESIYSLLKEERGM